MRTFTDNAGRTWTIALTLDAAKRVRDLLKVNLLDLTEGDPPLLTRLDLDVILLCDVIFCIVKPQADERKVTDEDFGRAMGGDAITAAHDAFWEELVDFFRQRRQTQIVAALLKQTEIVQKAIELVEKKINTISDKDLETAMNSGNWPGSSPGSPESPQAR